MRNCRTAWAGSRHGVKSLRSTSGRVQRHELRHLALQASSAALWRSTRL